MSKRNVLGAEGRASQMLQSALSLHQAGLFDEAAQLYQKVLRKSPRAQDALFGLGTLLAQTGRASEAVVLLKRAAVLRPNHSDAFGNLASAHRDCGNYRASLEAFRRAHELSPGAFNFHCGLGATLLLLGEYREAAEVLGQVVSLHPHEPLGWSNLGSALQHCAEPEQALVCLTRAISLAPQFPDAHHNLSSDLYDLGRYSESEAAAETALNLSAGDATACARARFNRGIARIVQGKTEAGWRDFEARLVLTPLPGGDSSTPFWTGREDVSDKKILLRAEQGLGDTIQFARYASVLSRMGAEVSLEVQAPLTGLLRSLPDVSQIFQQGGLIPAHDFQCAMMSLPACLGTADATRLGAAPYIQATPDLVSRWREKVLQPNKLQSNKKRIGFVCSGNLAHKNDAYRSIALELFLPLLSLEADFFLVQTDVRDPDRVTLQNSAIRDLSADLCNFEETAAFLNVLDLLISVDTSVAHLAGALGQKVWLLLPYACDYRWLAHGESTAWYPSMRLFRQPVMRDWASVFSSVRGELFALLGR